MHYASEQGHVQCLQMLVDAGGRYDIKDDNGKDSLDLVTPGGRKILERLSKQLSKNSKHLVTPKYCCTPKYDYPKI